MKRLFAILALVMAAAILPASAVYADAPIHVSGNYTLLSAEILETRQAGENTFITYHFVQAITGDITGTMSTIQHNIVHSDGTFNTHGYYTCDCTLAGTHYEVPTRFEGSGVVGQGPSGTWQVVGGPVEGHGTFTLGSSYEGWVHINH